MPAKVKTPPTFLRSSQTLRLVFSQKPNAAVRKSLREAGFRWNGALWFRTEGVTHTITAKELSELLTPAPVVEQAEAEPSAN